MAEQFKVTPNTITQHFNPAWFASVMGTAVIPLALSFIESSWVRPLSMVLMALSVILFMVFLLPWTVRFFLYPAAVKKDLNHPVAANFFPTMPICLILFSLNLMKFPTMFFSQEISLMLAYYPNKPRKQLMNLALDLKEKGMVRHLALSGHSRKLFPKLLESPIDIFQVRYNAANSGAEKDVFPFCGGENRPGMISFTATRWGQLLKESKMPPGEEPLTAKDCYRFVLSNPAVDVCMTGARTLEMMRENLEVLDSGPLNPEEMERIRRIGDHVYGKPRS